MSVKALKGGTSILKKSMKRLKSRRSEENITNMLLRVYNINKNKYVKKGANMALVYKNSIIS